MSWFEQAGATLGQYLKGKDVYDKTGEKQEIDDILKMGIGAAPKRVADKETPDTEELSPIKKMAFLTTDLLEEDFRDYYEENLEEYTVKTVDPTAEDDEIAAMYGMCLSEFRACNANNTERLEGKVIVRKA
tara:strand:- start:109 stop:501 length:393 start_codon:yes stop_codon:yes gene_type:complete